MNTFEVQVFVNDDSSYLAWLDLHRDGFVLNRQVLPSRFLTLHRATCWSIQGARPSSVYWTNSSEKVCGMDREALEEWAKSEVGQSPSPCRCCRAQRIDRGSVSMA